MCATAYPIFQHLGSEAGKDFVFDGLPSSSGSLLAFAELGSLADHAVQLVSYSPPGFAEGSLHAWKR